MLHRYESAHDQARRREQEIANEPAYFQYLDTLYARYGVTGPKQAMADLLPHLGATERVKLSKLMKAAGYTFPGLTDQY